MKTALSAVALFGLLLAASASNPAAATEDHRRDAPIGATTWTPNHPATGPVELHYVHDNDDDDDDDDDDDWRRRRWHNWNNGWNNWNHGWNNNWNNGWNNNWNHGWNNNWNNGWNNNWNNPWPHYGQPQPLPRHVIVFKLKQHHFYNVGKIKAKKGYYRIYAHDRWGRPVEIIMNPYTGRILRVGIR